MTSASIDFLKIDVEGAEADVLFGGDWERFRPKVIVAEAVTPMTSEPSWQAWEPFLIAQRYRFALFDTLNRFYVADEHPEIMARVPTERAPWHAVRHMFVAFVENRLTASAPTVRTVWVMSLSVAVARAARTAGRHRISFTSRMAALAATLAASNSALKWFLLPAASLKMPLASTVRGSDNATGTEVSRPIARARCWVMINFRIAGLHRIVNSWSL